MKIADFGFAKWVPFLSFLDEILAHISTNILIFWLYQQLSCIGLFLVILFLLGLHPISILVLVLTDWTNGLTSFPLLTFLMVESTEINVFSFVWNCFWWWLVNVWKTETISRWRTWKHPVRWTNWSAPFKTDVPSVHPSWNTFKFISLTAECQLLY